MRRQQRAERHTILLSTAYFVPGALTVKALVAATKRGVAEQIIIPGADIDSVAVGAAWRELWWGDLLKAGVRRPRLRAIAGGRVQRRLAPHQASYPGGLSSTAVERQSHGQAGIADSRPAASAGRSGQEGTAPAKFRLTINGAIRIL